MKEYQAYAKGDYAYGDTPRAAARAFFDKYPARRKCNIIEGELDGGFFRIVYDPKTWPYSAKDVTKKTIDQLPESVQ